jgi:hypothetical protein
MQPVFVFSMVLVWLVCPALAQVSGITPTVTVAMGDVGGKIFGKAPDQAKTRHYYIAAEPVQWDYAPLGNDPVCGKILPPPVQDHQPVSKLRYVQYTDATFSAKVFPTERLGILGPVLRGVVGETLLVTFLNRTPQPLSMHPHGVSYDKDNEGAYYQPNPGLGAAIAPEARFTYVWQLDEASGPLPSEPSSKGWLYHSHVTGDSEVNQGLMGFIIVTDPKRARPDGTPADVDREMASLFMIFDESGLDADALEALEYANSKGTGVKPPERNWTDTQQLIEAGGRHAINGLVFGNLTGLDMNEGERVRWYVFALGSEDDFHTAHWHGARVTEDARRRTDVIELLPATMKVADMKADNPGSWLYHCHVAEHMLEGMYTQFTVHPKTGQGVSREPATAFLGLSQTGESMRLKHAEIIDGTGLRLAGTVTVFEAFSVFNQSLNLELEGQTISFQPERTGVAVTGKSTLRVRNVNPFGIVYGGRLEFEITLQGPDWQPRIAKLKPSQDLSVSLHVGVARHHAKALLKTTH